MDFVSEQRWQADYARMVATHAGLKGREAEFKNYVFKPSHRGVPIETLANAFLYEIKEELDDETPPNTPPVTPQNTPVLATGGAGGPVVTTPEMSYEDSEKLRKEHPKEYNKLVRQGKIK
jgi:hypothetical protein